MLQAETMFLEGKFTACAKVGAARSRSQVQVQEGVDDFPTEAMRQPALELLQLCDFRGDCSRAELELLQFRPPLLYCRASSVAEI